MGRIFDVKRFAIHDGPGIRSTVFFTGCPLRCAWCHNPEAFAAVELDGSRVRALGVDELIAELERDVGYYDRSGGGVTLSGGEPLTQPEFVEAVLRKCRARDLRTAVDTSGCAEASLVEMAGRLANLVLYDLKTLDNEVHLEWTGAGNAVVLENLMLLDALEVEVWIRIPLVPGVNDGVEDLDAMIAGGVCASTPLSRCALRWLARDEKTHKFFRGIEGIPTGTPSQVGTPWGSPPRGPLTSLAPIWTPTRFAFWFKSKGLNISPLFAFLMGGAPPPPLCVLSGTLHLPLIASSW